MSIHSAEQLVLDILPQSPVVLEISPSQLTSDAGLLPMRLFDEKIGLTEQFAAALTDRRRDPEHTFLEMVRVRIFGLLADYEDQNDHDALPLILCLSWSPAGIEGLSPKGRGFSIQSPIRETCTKSPPRQTAADPL